ncbi:hypothetical protein [Hyunsoonleella ulvae]|uniref:hypothetical protein n=1 Tax=Hyunsoonleella ulvae TaxID=2799948 RepID=UPI00193A44AC|nr:hypothetical protein [Hyunsoonleella ulvae]
MRKKQLILIFLINSIIAFAYYFDNKDAHYSELSSDIQNIIPVAQKFDNPQLFQKDLYLNSLENVKYYTPFYIQTLRFIAKFTEYNYVQAINVLGFLCHLLFGILWFFVLFRFVSSFWVSLFISIVVRGVVWLPGLEMWGISDLWTIMPRTVYISLLPLPFIILSQNFKNIVLSSFLIGLIFNFHPITGLGGILLFLSLLLLYSRFFKEKYSFSITTFIMALCCVFIGMLPFILTYFGRTTSTLTYDPSVFDEFFRLRIPSYFNNPLQFLEKWIAPRTLLFLVPLIGYLYLGRKNQIHSKISKLLLVLASIAIVLPLLSIPIERFINNLFNVNFRMSFQLIRIQKVAIIPGFFALAYLLKIGLSKLSFLKNRYSLIFSMYVVLLVFSNSQILSFIPFISDDISKSILPQNLSLLSGKTDNELDIDRMSQFIIENTKETDVLCGSHIYRGATRRSVVFDGKSSSMLIEGNPKQFIEWQQRQQTISNLNSIDEVVSYLKRFDVDYYITRNVNVPANLVHKEGSIFLYKL